ncbi:MAG: histidine phosphatase family protein [Bdellovibrionales bacterium]|jgi:probable phosphoglycerate mutase
MPQLLLMRHGNTFKAGETPRWVGGPTDMPLTEAGEAQAHALASMIATHYVPLSAIIAGPLKRTKRMAEIIAEKTIGLFTVDERLCEINYGLWENKSNDEIKALYGEEILKAWEQEGVWPEEMNWAPSKAKLEHNIAALLEEQHKNLLTPETHNRALVTSNGILRFVYQALTGKPPSPEAKVKTGHYCVLAPTAEGWTIEAWNKAP